MKHIRTFENYKITKKREEIIKESVLQVNDIYKVRNMVDIPQSLVNAYVKRVKDNTGKNLRQFFSDVDIADEIVNFINTNFLDIENVPADLLMGGGTPEAGTEAPVETAPEVADEPVVEEPVADTPTEEAPEMEAPASEEAPVELPAEDVADFEEVSAELDEEGGEFSEEGEDLEAEETDLEDEADLESDEDESDDDLLL